MNRYRRQCLRLAGLLALAPAIPRWSWAAPPDLAGYTMGTGYRIRIAGDVPRHTLPRIRREIENILADVEQRLSLYRSDSSLSRLNRSPGQSTLALDPDTLSLVRSALDIQHLSDGAFSPFTANLVSRWGFGPTGRAGLDMADTGSALPDRSGLEIRDGTVRKTDANVALDLNGIAKGDAVDRVVARLWDHGIHHCLVEIGGEVAASGAGADGPWRVGVQDPDGNIISRIRLDQAAVATSGDHVHYFLLNGRRYSHLMDPRRGAPLEHGLALASVVAENTRLADAWSTALMVLGPEAGYAMAMRRHLAALFVERQPGGWRISRTPAYHALEETT